MERTKLATFGGQRLNAKFKQLFTAAGAPSRGGERREAPLSSEVSLSPGITQRRVQKSDATRRIETEAVDAIVSEKPVRLC